MNARDFLIAASRRKEISASLTQENCTSFLECLGDVAQLVKGASFEDVAELAIAIAQIVDSDAAALPESFYMAIRIEEVALRAIQAIVETSGIGEPATIAERIATDPISISMAMELLDRSYLSGARKEEQMRCRPEAKAKLTRVIAKNLEAAAKSGRLFATRSPPATVMRFGRLAPTDKCRSLFKIIKTADSLLDHVALAILSRWSDSSKGKVYGLADDSSMVDKYCSIRVLKKHARRRLDDANLAFPARAAWQSLIDGRDLYGVDGSPARFPM